MYQTINKCFLCICGQAIAITPQFPDFSEIKCFFLSLRDICMSRDVLLHRFSIAVVHYICAWHVPAQCCFISLAFKSHQFGQKTLYGFEFWSLDSPSARVCFWGRAPVLVVWSFPVSDIIELHSV